MNRLLKPSWIFCLAGIFALSAVNALARRSRIARREWQAVAGARREAGGANPTKAPTGRAGRGSEPAGHAVPEQAARRSCLAKRPAASLVAWRARRPKWHQAWTDLAARRIAAVGAATAEQIARGTGSAKRKPSFRAERQSCGSGA